VWRSRIAVVFGWLEAGGLQKVRGEQRARMLGGYAHTGYFIADTIIRNRRSAGKP
jgi:hypothetical protein